MFFFMTVMLLIEIIILAIAAGGCDEDSILNAAGTCGVSPGALYVPLVLLMIFCVCLNL